jgi:2-keto-4-pentenoate hydratase
MAVPEIQVGLMANRSEEKPAFDVKGLATRQWNDYQRRTPGMYFGEARYPLTLDQAYAVQTEIARLRCAAGDSVAGYKVGCIGPTVVTQFGMSGPIYARLFRRELYASGSTLRHGSYSNLAVEGEMAVRIGPGGEISEVFPVIELHQFVFRGKPKTLSELVANNGINVGAVLADDVAHKPLTEWAAARVLSVIVNEKAIDQGALWAMPGGPVEAVSWLRQNLQRHGLSLLPGELVLTGTPLGLHSVGPGSEVSVQIDGRRLVTCRIA